MRVFVALVLLCVSECSLIAQGPWILNETTGQRVRLRCLNWYGEFDNVAASVELISSSSANCVKLGYIPGETRGWDDVVGNLSSRGFLVFLGYEGRTQTREWVEGLENMTSMYKFNGVDIGNPSLPSTWGRSTDVYSDWMAAASMVCYRLHRIDPELLISIGAFCRMDLRSMMKRVGPGDAFERGKLIYSVTALPESFWFNDELLKVLNLTFGLSSFLAALCGCTFYVKKYPTYDALGMQGKREWRMAAASSMVFHVASLFVTLLFIQFMTSIHCTTLAGDVAWVLVLFSVLVAVSGSFISFCSCEATAFVAMCFFWASLFLFGLFSFTFYLMTPTAYVDFMDLMELNDRPVPVWVDKIGTRNPTDPVWELLWAHLLKKYELDFAYYAFNPESPYGIAKMGCGEWVDRVFVRRLFD